MIFFVPLNFLRGIFCLGDQNIKILKFIYYNINIIILNHFLYLMI